MKLLILTTIAALLALPVLSQAQDTIVEPQLQKTLDSLYVVEAKGHQQWATARGDSARTQAERARLTMIERHQPLVQALTNQYGLPTYKLVGQAMARRYGELVLRYDRRPAFQQQVQQLMAKEVKKNNVDDVAFATLTDVVELRAGRPQVYGTQLAYQEATGLVVREPLLTPLQVNARRATLGLEPLEAYLQKQKSKHQPTTKRQPKKG